MNAFSPNQIDPRILEELKRRQMMAQKAGILVGQNGGTAQPAPAMPAQPANLQTAQAADVPTLVGREVGGGLGNRPGSGIPVGGDRETLTQWMKRQGGGSPMGGQSPLAGGAGPDTLQGSASTDAAPASAAIPKRPASGGGIFSRLGSGLNDAGNGIRNNLGGDFGDRLGDFMAGMGAGRTPQESLAFGAQNALAGRQQRREDAKSEAEQNQTRRYAIMVGIPEDIAMNAPIPLLVEAIKQKMTPKEPDKPMTVSQGAALVGPDGKELYKNPSAPEKPNIVTLVGPDGKSAKSLDISSDGGRKTAQALLQAGWTERQGAGVNVNLGQAPEKSVFDRMSEITGEAQSAARSLPSFATARKALGDGTITGFAADQRLYLRKLGTLFGMPDEAVANTETFRSAMAPTVLALVKGLGAGTAISNADREFAEKAAGGNITLDEGSIKRLMEIGERAAQEKIKQHQSILDKVYPADKPENERPRALFSVQLPEMPKNEPAQSQSPQAPVPGGVPQIGDVEDGYRFKGGDPSKPESWEKVQ
jgi:hypothetical protein